MKEPLTLEIGVDRISRTTLESSVRVIPMASVEKEHATAYTFRRHLQKNLSDHLGDFPLADPCVDLPKPGPLPSQIKKQWPEADLESLLGRSGSIDRLPVDHRVQPVRSPGGSLSARKRLNRFLENGLSRYSELRNRPEEKVMTVNLRHSLNIDLGTVIAPIWDGPLWFVSNDFILGTYAGRVNWHGACPNQNGITTVKAHKHRRKAGLQGIPGDRTRGTRR